MRGRLSVEARRELIEAVGERYRAAGRIEKNKFSTSLQRLRGTNANMQFEYCEVAAGIWSRRDHSTGAFTNEAVVTALTIVWEAADRICGKRLKAVLPTSVESMEHHGHLCLDPKVCQPSLEISAATIDRRLCPVREVAKQRRRRAFLTTPLR